MHRARGDAAVCEACEWTTDFAAWGGHGQQSGKQESIDIGSFTISSETGHVEDERCMLSFSCFENCINTVRPLVMF